jgi:hypothetical protein
MGTCGIKAVRRSPTPAAAWISVSIRPGMSALTRMPSPASSRAVPMVKELIAPLAAA